MEATRLALALLVGFLVLGMCMSKPAQREKRMQGRHEARQFDGSCTEDEYACNSGECIPSDWECDTFVDCPDGGDEANCDPGSCTDDEYVCSTGQCIPSYWECDIFVDCPDGGDEAACDPGSCTDDDYGCNSGHCIPSYWECDFYPDCPDGDDEANCDYKKKRSASKLPKELRMVAKKQSEMKKSRLAAQKALKL